MPRYPHQHVPPGNDQRLNAEARRLLEVMFRFDKRMIVKLYDRSVKENTAGTPAPALDIEPGDHAYQRFSVGDIIG